MPSKDVRQIKINGRSIGVVGLTDAMEAMAEQYRGRSDEEIQHELVARLSKRNYIPANARDSYGKAFLREFKKSVGEPHEREASVGLVIQVVGPGCAQCDRLEMTVMEVLSELRLPAQVEHVRDVKEIGRMGILGTPALLIDGKVMAVGSAPPKTRIMEWLKQAAKQ